ncbi:MAG: Wzz/FepE/Etk N-terminal domain-containing protein [Candidatus Marinarcus sp.]|uniref:Wzz/FepE/Etk N-terminal domain-containing protein n=1 Tax=Candidatus Marinarcus sp. TaxID=3100987 RepID=UPI003AFF9390
MKENVIQEDEIDLRELFKTIWNKRVFIAGVVLVVTLCATVFAFLKTPTYKAKALFEIGEYKVSNNSSKILLDNVSELTKKLEILFIDIEKTSIKQETRITKISVPKGLKNYIEIEAEGISNDLLVKKLENIKNYIQTEHQKILNDVKQKRELDIKDIEVKISDIKDKEIVLLDKKIQAKKEIIREYSKLLKSIDKNLTSIQDKNPSLAALELMQKRDISNFIMDTSNSVLDMENKKNELLTTAVDRLNEEKNLLILLSEPHNYKNTEIVGQIMVDNHPVAPKKKLIIVVAFVTSFIIAIFLAFFMQFIKSFKEDKID